MTPPEPPAAPAPPDVNDSPAPAGGAPSPAGTPVQAPPPARRTKTPGQQAYAILTSPKLAIGILLVVLGCCLVGVTAVRGVRAGELIFATLWFNGLLVLLAVSSAAAFFSRIWQRKLTLVSVGMIVFHLSFMAVLGGVVVNSLYSFKGLMRLTEGETLPNDQLESYDTIEAGRFFDPGRLRGETTLVKMHTGYQVDGSNKRAAYEIEVGPPGAVQRAIIYITEYSDFDGIRYFCAKEGYSILLVLSDKAGQERYGLHVPLQSLRQPDGSYLYATGTASGPGAIAFPQPPEHPIGELELTYFPGQVERTGQVHFKLLPLGAMGLPPAEWKGLVAVGEPFDAGENRLLAREIRYWVGMDVRYDPGLPVVFGGLVTGLVGMVLTFVGRLRQGTGKKRAA